MSETKDIPSIPFCMLGTSIPKVGRKLLRFPPIRLIYYTVLFLALYAQELIYHHQVAELE